jgi:YgiT-type zinc finger domain-containing protein
MFDHQCEYCEGQVKPRLIKQEAFKHKSGFVILENITVGVCNACGNRYYSAETLHLVDEITAGKRLPERMEKIPVLHFT